MMPLLLNLLLALLWGAASGSFRFSNLAFGFAVGFGVLFAFREEIKARPYTDRAWQALRLFGIFLRQLVASNLRVAYDVITPRPRMRPALVAIELEGREDIEIMLLSNMITLTPGNLVVEISEDRRTMFMHAMYADDVDQARREVKEGFERAVLRLTS